MKKLIVANWKANPATVEEAVRLAQAIERGARKSRNAIVIAPPFPFLLPVREVLKKAKLGSQDIFWHRAGPYTGEVTPSQLKSAGAQYVIVGHSERRRLSETDAMINKKIKAAINAGLVPILCVGEWTRQGKSWDSVAVFVKKQLSAALAGVRSTNLVVTYEPVWAISTVGGKADRPEDAVQMVSFIRSWLIKKLGRKGEGVQILYGGSVNARNAKSFLKHNEIQGALVGGASLRAKEFLKICNAV